ncbi:MAG: 3-deoxy-7-phosphoheptulonate synthase [Anaerolineaceae bacterium]|nr:3-deoxy-7-phosphoheptulonate synthase [Anaerolineaceae bacterium]
MIVIMRPGAPKESIDAVIEAIEADGYKAKPIYGEERTIVGLVGESPNPLREENYAFINDVETVVRISAPYKLANRAFHPHDTVVTAQNMRMGGQSIQIIAGPCSVEDREMIIEIAHAVKEAGAVALRGGAFKPRTSPYSFQGHGEKALKWMAEAREQTGLAIVTEIMDTELVPMVADYADVLQIGARNMQNFALLRAVGRSKKPVLLKRGMASTVQDLLMAAEYILSEDNPNVILCERGIRTFETATRNTSDINAIPVLKELSHLPVVFDPSHAVGKWEYVEALSRAGIAAGADGLIVEVHPHPGKALSDGRQSLTYNRFESLVEQVNAIANLLGRVEDVQLAGI